MKSVMLIPYCPYPAMDGARMGLLTYMKVIRQLGPCRIVSAAGKPVGRDWTPEHVKNLERQGFEVRLRERECRRTLGELYGMIYAVVCKGLKLEKAFGHANPYHRYAFPQSWWNKQVEGMDVAIIHYSYWAHLRTSCPKVVILHDLYSNVMWGGAHLESKDLRKAGLIVCISCDEEKQLKSRGFKNTLWVPPASEQQRFEDSSAIGMVGSSNSYNREGMRWLESVDGPQVPGIRIYGSIAGFTRLSNAIVVGRYENTWQPYRDCGVILLTTAQGLGVQVKAVEALSAGRAIIARRGAMRGLVPGNGWIEVDTPEEMIRQARVLSADKALRKTRFDAANNYYMTYLNPAVTHARLKEKVLHLSKADF